MLDEPFAGVDPIAVEDIQHIVWQLKYRNIGILITDHNVHETLNITDRAYLLFEGRILFQGSPEELAANRIVKEKSRRNVEGNKRSNRQKKVKKNVFFHIFPHYILLLGKLCVPLHPDFRKAITI